MRRVAFIMGMPISLDIPGCQDVKAFETVFDELRAVDDRFSPYKKTSELFRYRSGEITEKKLSRQMQGVIKACKKAQKATDGHFSAWASDQFDPSGYVKGWAIARAGSLLEKNGYNTYCLSAGGDIQARSDGQKTWRIGLQHPRNPESIFAKISGKNFAVATSGSYERGQHIINPKSHRPAKKLVGLTVVGPNIITADILATAGFVAGNKAIELIMRNKGYEALAIDKKMRIAMTPKMVSLVSAP